MDKIPHAIKILIVDDHLLFLESMSFLINSIDFLELVGIAGSAEETFTAISVQRPDIILCDYEIGKLSGIDVTNFVKLRYSGVKILLLTMYEDRARIMTAVAAGVDGVISKKVTRQELINAIKAVMKDEKYYSQAFESMLNEKNTNNLPFGLTPRENEILTLLAEGKSNKIIASICNVSYFTVTTHMKNIYKKMGISSATEAVMMSLRQKTS